MSTDTKPLKQNKIANVYSRNRGIVCVKLDSKLN